MSPLPATQSWEPRSLPPHAPSSSALPFFCPPIWSPAALKKRRRRIGRPLQPRRPRRRREGSTKPAARCEVILRGEKAPVVQLLLPARMAGSRAGWGTGTLPGAQAGVGRTVARGAEGTSNWLPLRPQVTPLSPEGFGMGASGWPKGSGPAGQGLGAPRGGPDSLGRPLISPRRTRSSKNPELAEASVTRGPSTLKVRCSRVGGSCAWER